MMSAVPAADAGANANDELKGTAAGFGLAAVIAILFNTALTWAKDAYEPLNAYLASFTGDTWRTHGVVDVVVFFVLGYYFTSNKFRIKGARLAALLAAASVVAGCGLALGFALV
jgi:uncharacterized BrkB/YihY/UPF0761 family membrane protein